MAPNSKGEGLENFLDEPDQLEKLVAPQADGHKYKVVYYMVAVFVFMHISGLYGISYVSSAKWTTLMFMYIYFVYGFMGLTAGGHRLWAHKAFKAKLPLQIILMLAHSAINQFSVLWWAQTHRQHHKYSDTDGDPVNATRGFFYSHIGWLLVRRHPKALERRRFLNVADLTGDPLLKFQKKYSLYIIAVMSVLFPSLLPVLWGETFTVSWYLNMLRLIVSYNALFAVNSVGHRWGNKPYDKHIKSTETEILSFVVFGEGYHNYHHTFPWDYRSGELGGSWNFTTMFIDMFAKIGWAYDMRTVPKETALARAERNGDGSRIF